MKEEILQMISSVLFCSYKSVRWVLGYRVTGIINTWKLRGNYRKFFLCLVIETRLSFSEKGKHLKSCLSSLKYLQQ